MNQLRRFEARLLLIGVGLTAASALVGYLTYLLIVGSFDGPYGIGLALGIVMWLLLNTIFMIRFIRAAMRPVESMYAALAHVATDNTSENAPPKPEPFGISNAIVEQVLKDVYEIGSGQSKAQLDLSISRDFAEAIAEVQSSPLIALDRAMKIKYANPAAIELMPRSVESPLGLTINEVLAPEFASGVSFDDWAENARKNKVHDRHLWERVHISKTDNTQRVFDMTADYTKNELHGVEFLIVLIDKTSTYHAEEKEMDFISVVVHELRTPISLLRGYIEVFDQELSSKLNDDQKEFMSKMTVASRRLSTFMNNILNVARIENNSLSLHLHEDTIYEALETMMDDFTLRASVSNCSLEFELMDNIPSLALDRVALYEVMSNLIDNAIKYSNEGGVVRVVAKPLDGGGVSVSIVDEGIGIPASSLENLFERYYRSHHSRDRVSGTGLGLYLSKRIIEAHDGTIWVRSTEGEGSTFGFDLPSYEQSKLQNGSLEQADGSTIERSAHGWIKNHGKVRK